MAQRARFPSMLRFTFCAITLLFCAFGLFVFAAFGAATGRVRVPTAGGDGRAYTWHDTTVMQNLPSDGFVLGAPHSEPGPRLAFS